MVLDECMEFLFLPLLGLAATAVVIAVARRKQQGTQSSTRSPMFGFHSPVFRTPTTQCPHCLTAIGWEATKCRHCGMATVEDGEEDSSEEEEKQKEEDRKKAKAKKTVQILIFAVMSLMFLLLGAILPLWPFLLAGGIIFGMLAFLDWRASRGSPEEN